MRILFSILAFIIALLIAPFAFAKMVIFKATVKDGYAFAEKSVKHIGVLAMKKQADITAKSAYTFLWIKKTYNYMINRLGYIPFRADKKNQKGAAVLTDKVTTYWKNAIIIG